MRQNKDTTPSPSIPKNEFAESFIEGAKEISAKLSQSIPVKEELLDMVSPIWEVAVFEMPHGKEVVIKEAILKDKATGKWQFADRIAEVSTGYGNKIAEGNAKAICTAVNNTYGKNLDPAKYEQVVRALEDLCKEIHLGKLNIRKDFSLINAHAQATKAIYNAKTIKP